MNKTHIKALRRLQNLKQTELAEIVGVSEVTIRNWETGRTGTDLIVQIARLCRALDCQVEDLVKDDDVKLTEPVKKIAA